LPALSLAEGSKHSYSLFTHSDKAKNLNTIQKVKMSHYLALTLVGIYTMC